MSHLSFQLQLLFQSYVIRPFRTKRIGLLLLIASFVAGLILGLCFSSFAREKLFIYEYSSGYVSLIFHPDTSISTLILKRVFGNFQFFLLLFALSFSIFLSPLQVLFLVYRGFIVGAVSISIVAEYGFVGIVNVAVLIFPVQLMLAVCFSLYLVQAIPCAMSFLRQRSFCGIKHIITAAIITFILSFGTVIFEIVVVLFLVRPFNLSV
ncbi:MAG: hypothetical protein IJF71_07595 [Clostridia bacterium]|nr:hypothetical protein [Clostridia bacterium]